MSSQSGTRGGAMLQALDAAQVRRWAVACVQSLDAHREAIDSINVYPVPDGDTGSNLLHTMRAALDALLRAPARTRTSVGAAMTVLARGALTGARGNSGVIISQFLRGVAEELEEPTETDAPLATASPADTGPAADIGPAAGTAPAASAGLPPDGSSPGADSPPNADSPGEAALHAPDAAAGDDATVAGEALATQAALPALGAPAGAGTQADTGLLAGAGPLADAGPRAESSASAEADALADAHPVLGPRLRAALVRGAELARAAMADPVPGTMVTVLEAAASAARGESSDALQDVVAAAATAAAAALDETPGQLAVLADAGVVDAGGRGVVVLFDALYAVVTGQPAALAAAQRATAERTQVWRTQAAWTNADRPDAERPGAERPGAEPPDAERTATERTATEQAATEQTAAQRAARRSASGEESSLYTSRESGSDAFAYEVMYLLEQVADNGDHNGDHNGGSHVVDHLRDTLVGLGDSVSVVGDGAGLWTVHVHCNDIGAAIEAGVDAGRPRQIRVARFADAPSPESSRFTRDRAVVVPSRNTEFTDLLVSEGITVVQVSADGPDEALAYRMLETITRTAAAHVTVLPADAGLVEAADEASIRAVAAGQDVVVVPCASPVQVLAAVAVHDPRRRAGDDVVAMAEAAAATRRGEVVVATEAAITWIGACDAGDVLGFADGEVMFIEPGPADLAALDRAACGVVKRMLTMGGELVTALLGADAPEELAMELEDFLRREHPETELVVYQGGQRDSVLVLGVE